MEALSVSGYQGSTRSPFVGFFAWSFLLLGWFVILMRGLIREVLQRLDCQSRSSQTLTACCLGSLLDLPTQAKGQCLQLWTYALMKAGDPDHT